MKLSIGRLSACCLTLLFALPLPVDARPKIDSVVVLNGDRVTGEIKGMENGILQAWEIMEEMRFRANLAVLSACQSGLGRDGQTCNACCSGRNEALGHGPQSND